MTIWFIFGLMTLGAVFAVLWPLRDGGAPGRGGDDLAVYRDQLDELERDRSAGLVGAAEAEAARTEIGRRLLAAADAAATSQAGRSSPRRRRVATIAAVALVPLVALLIYGALGSPGIPDAPFGARRGAPLEARSMDALLAQVEDHLNRNPEDGRGWEVVGPVYMRLGRFDDAVRARRNALRLNGATAARETDLGEALTAAANGVVTADAKSALQRALALDARDVKARYLLGLSAEQDGRGSEAAALWRALLAEAPAGAPWAEVVKRSLARVDPSSPAATAAVPPPAEDKGPNAAEVAAAAAMAPQDRSAMVRGMVERLSARLHEDGSDVEGWLRLLRAYVVLGEPDKAKAAASDARRASANDPDKLRRINDAVKAFGLES